jgi:NAD(P)-dependent dehydrogenase (short-subunit alcohol dehydrogenase family)
MRERKNGSIIQISSHAGVKAFAGFGVYNASKFALEGFSEALAQEVAPLGIKVIIVEPGPFRTNFAGRSLVRAKMQIEEYSETAGKFRKILDNVHGKQEGDPHKAAVVILEFVNSDSTSLRLPLGTIPLKTIGAKIESLQDDLNANRALAIQAVF